jgi:hypothetical protein
MKEGTVIPSPTSDSSDSLARMNTGPFRSS